MSLVHLLMWTYYIVPLTAAVVTLVFGIMVTASKIKQTKILGISLILSALGSAVAGVYNLFMVLAGSMVVARLATVQSAFALIVAYACSVCTCIYIHRNYQKKYIYFPLLLIPLASSISNAVIVGVINRMNSENSAGSLVVQRIGMAQNINSLIFNVAVSLIVIIVFYKHRDIERYIPHYYIISTIALVWRCIGFSLYIIYYAILASSAAKNGFAAYSSADPVQVLLIVQTIIGSLISLIFPIYLFVRVLRASREPEEPEVMLVGENDMPPIDDL